MKRKEHAKPKEGKKERREEELVVSYAEQCYRKVNTE